MKLSGNTGNLVKTGYTFDGWISEMGFLFVFCGIDYERNNPHLLTAIRALQRIHFKDALDKQIWG